MVSLREARPAPSHAREAATRESYEETVRRLTDVVSA
jgi:hypothetical protein